MPGPDASDSHVEPFQHPVDARERIVAVGDVELCLETFGRPEDPAVLLIGGAAASMDWWDAELCERLASSGDGGRFVVRYDHRDTGRSTTWPAGHPAYAARELTSDALRILDALGVGRAHLVGVSMGGGIAQELAARHPDRVLTLTLIATSPAGTRTGGEPLPPPAARIRALLDDPGPEPDWSDRAAVVDHIVAGERLFAGPLGRDEDEPRLRRIAESVVDRTRDVAASRTNHWLLVDDDGDDGPGDDGDDGDDGPGDGDGGTFRLADLRVPTLVVHGTDDPLFPLPHGEALAAEIPGASLLALPGMGHQVPPPATWDVVVPAVAHHTALRSPGRPAREP